MSVAGAGARRADSRGSAHLAAGGIVHSYTPAPPPSHGPHAAAHRPPVRIRRAGEEQSWALRVSSAGKPTAEQRCEARLRDMLYSRAFQLRRTFRALDTEHTGSIPLDQFRDRVVDLFNLSDQPEYIAALQRMIESADVDGSGSIQFKEFSEVLNRAGHTTGSEDAELERERFNRPGVLDSKLATLMANEGVLNCGMGTCRPCNELGAAWTSPPYAVLGDAERMSAIGAAYLNARTDRVVDFFRMCDIDGNGRLSHKEFRAGLRKTSPHMTKLHEEELIRYLDADGRGYVKLEEFLSRCGIEFMKKPSQQGSPGAGQMLLWPASVKPPVKPPEPLSRQLRRACAPRAHTRGEALRAAEVQRVMLQTDPRRAERMRVPEPARQQTVLRSFDSVAAPCVFAQRPAGAAPVAARSLGSGGSLPRSWRTA